MEATDATALRAKVTAIQSELPPGIGMTLNLLYINPHQFSFQLPLWQDMRKEGLPIEGPCCCWDSQHREGRGDYQRTEMQVSGTLCSSRARWKGSDRSSASTPILDANFEVWFKKVRSFHYLLDVLT